ncbi:Mss4-like protein [Mycena polygramma]|nr:Mss4-like protein [Mycena polygramma]
MSESPQLVAYRGNCHCGAFKFTLKVPELKEALSCTCSICSKNGYLWTFPAPDQFEVVVGDENTTLTSYMFGKRMTRMAHKAGILEPLAEILRRGHCSSAPPVELQSWKFICPTAPSWAPQLWPLILALDPPYQTPEPVDVGPVAEGTILYHGNCHCGAIGYKLVNPEKISKVRACNCSICSRDACLWVYPDTTTVTFRGLESAVGYAFATGKVYHRFCKTCGVSVFGGVQHGKTIALNVRTVNGLDLAALEIEPFDGKSIIPAYEL